MATMALQPDAFFAHVASRFVPQTYADVRRHIETSPRPIPLTACSLCGYDEGSLTGLAIHTGLVHRS